MVRVASTLVFGFANGGPVAINYGLLLISIIYTATTFSLAELAARYPTAGGQYHWTYILAPPRLSNQLVCPELSHVRQSNEVRVTRDELSIRWEEL